MKNVVVLISALVLCVCAPVFGQSTFGTFVGTVQDQSGSSIPAVTITATNVDTAGARTATSNDAGTYELPNLQPGTYVIAAEKPGFAAVKTDRVTLDARQERRVDLTMGVAAVQQTVEVTGQAAAINTENANIANTINNSVVNDLPENYRGSSSSPLGAIVALPNVQQDQNGTIALTGSLPFMTDYSVDGTSTVNVQTNAPAVNMYPSTEMLAEFKVSAINNNAELESSADVTVTTKGGSNTFHGSAFEYLQNRALDATAYGSVEKPAKVWNDFGASLSGPVIIPKLYSGHDRTFFFMDYEGNRKPGSQLVIDNVPTPAMVAGNLNGVPGPPAVNPFTNAPFPNNQIPANLLNPVAQKLLSTYYPAPNYNSGSTIGNYRTLERLANQTDGYDIRVDQYIGTKNQLFGRWSWKNLPYQAQATLGSIAQLLPPINVQQDNRNLVLSDNYTITAHLVNEFRFGYSNLNTAQNYPFSGASVVSSLGLQGLALTSAGSDGGFPGFNFSAGTGFTPISHGDIGPSSSRTIQYTDNISWIKGNHTLKFGVDFRTVSYTTVNNFGLADEFGYLNFLGSFSGNAFADLLLGVPSLNIVFDIGPHIDEISHHFATYAQDEWRVTKNLTLSFGLRWELQPPFTEAHGNIANFDPVNGGELVYPNGGLPPAPSVLYSINTCPGVVNTVPCSPVLTASEAHLPQGLRYTYYRNFDPRFGVAWRPFNNDKTVFRAGFGIFTVPTLGGVAYQMAGTGATNSPTYVNALVNGSPLFQLPSVAYGNGGLVPSDVGTYTFDVAQQINYRDPQSVQWNVTIERQLLNTWATRISYIGENSYRLPLTTDQNSIRPSTIPYSPSELPYPQWGPIYQLGNWGFANYQDLELQVSHRMASGFYLQAQYDWAKDLSDANNDAPAAYGFEQGNFTGPLGFVVGVNDRFDLRDNRGNAPGDRRQRFLLTGIYQLPFGSSRKYLANSNRFVNGVLGGWQLSTIVLAETGPYLTAYDSNAAESQANLNELNRPAVVRPDQIAPCNISNPTPNGWFNDSAFVPTPVGAGRIGNAGVGDCEGPGTVTVAAGLSKVFVVRERVRLRFESTFTNILNHPNFAPPPSMDVSCLTQFGGNSSTCPFGVTQSVQSSENAGNRVGQLSLRLDF
ncbi:MAG: carboxypeptidase regulatory-like domain-containing protein [Bryobacterales bacterium]|nr:carboxypeptidase regulatory-like domain-containing protein [Bryobacterales bacterium]